MRDTEYVALRDVREVGVTLGEGDASVPEQEALRLTRPEDEGVTVREGEGESEKESVGV